MALAKITVGPYGSKGDKVLNMNYDAVDRGIEGLVQVEVPASWSALKPEPEDMKSRTVNEVLTPGFNLRVTGTKLRVVGDKPGVGIFFRETATNTATKVDEGDIVVNNPSELMIIIPALPAGTYQLEVTTRSQGMPPPFHERSSGPESSIL